MTAKRARTSTLLVCTSGRPGLLRSLLNAVASGTVQPNQVVVVNGSDNQTPDVVAAFASRFEDLVLIEHPNRNLATLRNLGLPHCRGDIVAMTDDDAVPAPDWLECILQAYEDTPQAGGIGGPVQGVSRSLVSRISDIVVFPAPREGRPVETLPTVNMSYPKTVMTQIGAFDEALFRGEDVDYNWRVLASGFELRYDPRLRVRHNHRGRYRGLLQQQWMYGRAYVLVRSKWPAMYSVYPHSLRSPRAWAKLVYATLAIVLHPWQASRRFESRRDRLAAFPLLVGHHFTWKLAMLREAYLPKAGSSPQQAREPRITRWHGVTIGIGNDGSQGRKTAAGGDP